MWTLPSIIPTYRDVIDRDGNEPPTSGRVVRRLSYDRSGGVGLFSARKSADKNTDIVIPLL